MDKKASKKEHAATNFIRNIIVNDLAASRFANRHWNGRPGDGDFQRRGTPDAARIRTRFPPEPNGYLHLGHAKSIFLNFGLARDFRGRCHLRFDDTNPTREEQEYVDSILDAVRWLGFDWADATQNNLYFASDYFERLYECAEFLIARGHAYVDQLSAEEMRLARGTLTEPGRDSPYRDRAPLESLELLRQMRAGKHPEGSMVVRARIDMTSPNINMRDPALYRIRFAHHHRTGDQWCIYPMYDFAHALSDALEFITHSICTLEFEDHRPLYDWCVERCVPTLRAPQWREALELVRSIRAQGVEAAREFALHCHNFAHKLFASEPEAQMRSLFSVWDHARSSVVRDLNVFFDLLLREAEQFAPLLAHALEERRPDPFDLPRQYEFSRLNVDYVVLSKRKLIQLVEERVVDGWDDPRMPTLIGLRRRGYTPQALGMFAERIGVSKADSRIDFDVLEQALREELDPRVPRAMVVLDPLRLVLTNIEAQAQEICQAAVHPHLPERGMRQIMLRRELWIDADDFQENPPPDFFRLTPGGMVRLRYAYVIRCTGCEKDAAGKVRAVYAEVLPQTRSGTPGANSVKVKGAIHWLSVADAMPIEVRLFDRLFVQADPDSGTADYRTLIDSNSRRVVSAYAEASLVTAQAEDRFQFERHGYFVADRVDHRPHRPVFNRTATLKDSRSR
ncbi:MAG TPA: glutamine--tRNA ligase [Burkholderiaceae bacterium]|nr:glutamine--tRNA ligase [Burkholderiaceae bacterium]